MKGNCGECDRRWCCYIDPDKCNEWPDPVPMTNADRIREMSDEELAWELMMWRCEAVAKHHGIESQYPDTQKTILEWLQQPYEGGEEDKHGTETD